MKKYVLIVLVLGISLVGVIFFQYVSFYDKKLQIVFCDVGQGDAIFIKSPSGKVILIDGGPDESVLSCLSQHLPFWHRKIDLLFLSHPHLDHFFGLISVFDRFTIKQFATEKLANNTPEYGVFLKKVKDENVRTTYLYTDDTYRLPDGLILKLVGPSQDLLQRTSPNGLVNEGDEPASLQLLLTYGEFSLLLTGDSEAVHLAEEIEQGLIPDIDVLQVPHHGSKTGLNASVLAAIAPEAAVISVGKKNRFRHPTQEILHLLQERKTAILRTDLRGAVRISSDGKQWWVD
jgi:competence protein ComEC